MNKVEIKKKRREVLLTINRMSRLCSCKPDVERVQDRCCNCRDMSKLGKQLDQLLVERRKHSIKDSKYPEDRVTWTDSMTEELKRLAPEYNSTEIARMMGMKREQIANKCKREGLSTKRETKRFRFYEDGKFVAEGSIVEISEVTGLKYNVLSKYGKNKPTRINREMVLINE